MFKKSHTIIITKTGDSQFIQPKILGELDDFGP